MSELALQRLRADDGDALRQLARLMVDETTATPLGAIASPRWLATQLTAAAEAATRGDAVRDWVKRRLAAERERWASDARPLSAWLPVEAEEPLRKLLGRPYAPDEDLVFAVIDQAALQGLVKAVLADSVQRWRKKVGDVDKGLLGGIGKKAAQRSRGLFGNLGGMAENIVGAVREEVENTFDVRVGDVTGGATHEAMRTIARYLADPEHAPAFADMRLSVLDVLLARTVADLVREADKLGVDDAVDVMVGALRAAVSTPGFVDRVESRLAAVMAEAGDGTLGAWLDEVGLRDVWTETTTDLLTERLMAVVRTDPFARWWSALHQA